MELCNESLRVLINYWVNQRNYARECRKVQEEYLKEQPERVDFWKKRHEKWDARHKQCAQMVRTIKKRSQNQLM